MLAKIWRISSMVSFRIVCGIFMALPWQGRWNLNLTIQSSDFHTTKMPGCDYLKQESLQPLLFNSIHTDESMCWRSPLTACSSGPNAESPRVQEQLTGGWIFLSKWLTTCLLKTGKFSEVNRLTSYSTLFCINIPPIVKTTSQQHLWLYSLFDWHPSHEP